MSKILEEKVEEATEETVELPKKRVNDFCVISKSTFGYAEVHDIQTNSAWTENPYGELYAVVPDEMVADIMATGGYCDIELSEEGTEVVSFTRKEIPDIPEQPTKPQTYENRIAELEENSRRLTQENLESMMIEADLLYEISILQLGLV